MKENKFSAGIGDLKRITRRTSDQRPLAVRWVLLIALASVIGAVIVSWAFVRLIMFIVFR